MRVAVVGCGYWGSRHVRVMANLDEVGEVVVVEPDENLRTQVAATHGELRHVAALEDALPLVDAVVVATPAATHFELASRAIEAGKHVLVEKPMTATTDEALALVEGASAAGVALMVGHTFEHHGAVRSLRDLVFDGALGRLHFLDACRLNFGPIRRDVCVIADLAAHDVAIANFLLGSTPTAVTAWTSTHTHPKLADAATIRLDYEAVGVVATVRVSWLDPCKVRRTTVVGERAMALLDDMDVDARLRLFDRRVIMVDDTPDAVPDYHEGDIVVPDVDDAEPLRVQDQHFVQAALTGTRPSSDGWRGFAVVNVLEAAQRSAQEGRTVQLELVNEPVDRLLSAAPAR